MTIDTEHWNRRLAEIAERHDVPGATLGILHEGEIGEAAYGVLNLRTGVDVTTDSLFQIGSISKVWTTTLVMQLVDEGKLQLDAPLVDVLPELRLSDPGVTAKVTMRHLLTHTSGIDGDVFTDTGRGDDCLEKYVAGLADAAQNHPLEATWSYCNSGFSLAGRVIEKLTGGTWDAAVRERLVAPLGLTRTVTLPEEALLHRAAAGHVTHDGKQTVAPVWAIPRSAGPAGSIISTVADLLTFAKMHLDGGVSPGGARVLGEASVAAMAEHQVELPDKHTLGDSWGLGWERADWAGHRLIGHDGNTIGQAAFLRILPGRGFAVALLTNGGNGAKLYEELYREIFAELVDVPVPHPLGPPSTPVEVDPTPYVGVYERASIRQEISVGANGPVMRVSITGAMAELLQEQPTDYPMVAVAPDLFVCQDPETGNWVPATFYELPTGEKYVHFGARATPRCAS
ncbi:serine hydrolase domain-containing protein [Paractinoplanes lichenicola]|uniref:Beta-lactamase family protein n=1 Tax=Paractinoplanes lichenicola TaxID=2802976 RepID=A0ABS1VDZ1_9ACTN|nr:serine hydrolase domain-containing protein [Actinoplanes lichenicola]MBL7252910.1 beta-lactamase family protein [Actinoplanes lichenicola]